MTWSYDPADNRIVENNGTTAMPFYYNNLNLLTRRGGAGQTLIQGIVNEGSKVEVNNQPAMVMSIPGSSDYSFSRIVDVTSGSNTVTIKATDAANLVKNEAWQFNIPAEQELLTYDPNGNMTSGGGRTYTWDSKNRLLSITYGGNTYSFEYDGMDRRVTEKVNGTPTKRWIWDGFDLVEERNASNVVTQNFYKTGLRIGTTTYLYTVDHLGSPREIIDAAAGTVSARYAYDMWGKTSTIGTPTVSTPIGFTGHYKHDASGGTLLAPYRAYDPGLGRWISRDPIGERETPNLYTYCLNNPIGFWDPLGLDRWACDALHTYTIFENPDSPTGYSQIDYGPLLETIPILILTRGLAAPGGVYLTDVPGHPPEDNTVRRIPSTPEQDRTLKDWVELMQQDPPWYVTPFFNCRHFSAIANGVGIGDGPSYPPIPFYPPVFTPESLPPSSGSGGK